jgi:exopolysaccharide biosynthesis protein
MILLRGTGRFRPAIRAVCFLLLLAAEMGGIEIGGYLPVSFEIGELSRYFDEDIRKTETIAPGIERIEIKRGNWTSVVNEFLNAPANKVKLDPETTLETPVASVTGSERWTINILRLDPAKIRLELGIAMDEIVGAEPTSSIAARHDAVAAVNGGYFRTTGILKGEPAGMMWVGGKILSEPAKGRASLAVANTDGKTRIAVAQVTIKATLKTKDGASCSIDGFNRDRAPNELIILTPEFHRTTLTDASGMEAVVRDGRVVEIRDNQGSSPIPADGFVISARGAARDWMRISIKTRLKVEIETKIESLPPLPFRPDFIIGGGPRLLAEGRPVPSEASAYPEGFYATRHPRTAAGVCADGTIILAVVDGRQPKIGVGMSIDELAALMGELGCVEAINMDGGGSSTMVVKGRVVNSPSDAAGERAVSDALLVFKK